LKERIVTELLDEARTRRAQEALLAFDRHLEETRRQVLRSRPGMAALAQAIGAAQDASQISARSGLETASGRGERLVRRLVEKLLSWYLVPIAERTTRFADAAVRSLGQLSDSLEAQAERVDALAERLEALLEEAEAARPPSLPALPRLGPAGGIGRDVPPEPELVTVAAGRLTAAEGRVLHADCGRGAAVAALLAAGIDAHGTDPSAALVDEPAVAGLDLVQAEAIGHLQSAEPGGLGGTLLSGFVDRLTPGDARRLAFLLRTRVAPLGPIVLIGTQPTRWQREASPVQRDLAPGRPLHPETWGYLLGEYGFSQLETVTRDELGAFVVTGRRGAA
jgi:hypothetical protein